MQKYTLTKVYRTKQTKEGTPLVTKQGKPYERLSIQVQEKGEHWISGFGDKDNEGWKDGDVVVLDVYENNGYLNFRTPSKLDLLEKRVEALENMSKAAATPSIPATQNTPSDPTPPEISQDDIDNMF